MLRSVEDLKSCRVICPDGNFGEVKHIYFDDETWGIRFIVIEATGWNDWQEVWVSPLSIGGGRFRGRRCHIQSDTAADEGKPSHRYRKTSLPPSGNQALQLLRMQTILDRQSDTDLYVLLCVSGLAAGTRIVAIASNASR